MNPRLLAATFLLGASPALAAQDGGQSAPSGAIDAQQRERMLRELEELRAAKQNFDARIGALEAELGATPPPSAPAAEASAPVTIARQHGSGGNHHLELYGFAQVDAIQDFDRVDPSWDATLRPSKIPTDEGTFGDDGQSIFSARQSRLGVKGTGEPAGKL